MLAMKDLTQECEVRKRGGVPRGSREASQPRLPSAPVGWTPDTLILEGLGQCFGLPVEPLFLTRKWLLLLSGTLGCVKCVFSAELRVGMSASTPSFSGYTLSLLLWTSEALTNDVSNRQCHP